MERVERGDPGDPQADDGASYFSFFEPEYAWIDSVEARRRDCAPGSLLALPSLRRPMEPSPSSKARPFGCLRVALEPGEGHAVECGNGTLWIVESEPA